jgi:DNA-binding response OmpR family regulator
MAEDMSADPLHGLRVLCLDNDPEILKGLEVLLRGWGCDVVATSGDDVDGLAPAFIPEAVIVDYHLDNGANGVTLARMLRARFGEGVPVLLATADRSDEVAQSARSSGLDVLYKPLRPAGLRSWLNRVGRLHEAYSVSADVDAASMGPTAMTT